MYVHEAGEQKKRWYRKGWVWILVGIGALLTIYLVSFVAQVRKAVDEIESGSIATGEFAQFMTQGEETSEKTGSYSTDVETLDDPSLGPPDARVVIVGFEDFECPFCRRAFPIIREIMTRYKDSVRFVYRDFPLSEIHPNAVRAAVAAECAHEQGKFWEYHDKLYSNQNNFSQLALQRYAMEVNSDMDVFNRCFSDRKYAREIQEDFQAGIKAGVSGTPTWFINGRKIAGVVPLEAWEEIIKAELNK